jgi:hypothetical protein
VRPTNDLSEGEELDTHIKMHMEREARGCQLTTEPKEVLAIQETSGSDSELTDLKDNPTPKNNRRGLKRSYAMADLSAIQAPRDQHDGSIIDDKYEPPSEPERESGITVLDDDDCGDDYCDDDPTPKNDYHNDNPTPKKKKKVAKVPVREVIGASHEEPEFSRERSKVSVTKGVGEFQLT